MSANKADRSSRASRAGALNARAAKRAAEWGIEQPSLRHRMIARQDELTELFYSGDPLPVGTCLYPKIGKRGFEVVYSRFHALPDVSHPTPAGQCTHRLAIDDGALFVVQRDDADEYDVKVATAECTSSRPMRTDRGTWARTDIWRIPCPHRDFDHQLVYEPTGHRYDKDDKRPKRRPDPMADLRPVAREHPAFREHHGRRNDSESYNEWFQNTLAHHSVAQSLEPALQHLDFLCGAVLNNSNIWAAFDQ